MRYYDLLKEELKLDWQMILRDHQNRVGARSTLRSLLSPFHHYRFTNEEAVYDSRDPNQLEASTEVVIYCLDSPNLLKIREVGRREARKIDPKQKGVIKRAA